MSDFLPVMDVPGLIEAGGLSLNDYLLSLSPTLYCKFNESSGNLINYGSDGNSGGVTNTTQGQTGQLGANEAYLFNGTTSICTFTNANVAGTKALTTQRWCFLAKPTSLGESNAGHYFRWGDGVPLLAFGANNVIVAYVDLNSTDCIAGSNNNQVDWINSWALVFVDYDDANALGLGRRARILRATAASATTLLTLANNTAGVGTVVPPATNLNIGNRTSTAGTFAGLLDLVFMGAGLWSPDGSPADLTLCDTIRSLVFGV